MVFEHIKNSLQKKNVLMTKPLRKNAAVETGFSTFDIFTPIMLSTSSRIFFIFPFLHGALHRRTPANFRHDLI